MLCTLLGLVAVATAVAGWAADPPELTATEAVKAASGAFASAELTAEVDPRPGAGTYVSRNRGAVEVWRVGATVEAGRVLLLLSRDGAEVLAIDDRTPDGSDYVLSDAQYTAVARGIEDPTMGPSVRRRVALTVGAVLVVALALALALVVDPLEHG